MPRHASRASRPAAVARVGAHAHQVRGTRRLGHLPGHGPTRRRPPRRPAQRTSRGSPGKMYAESECASSGPIRGSSSARSTATRCRGRALGRIEHPEAPVPRIGAAQPLGQQGEGALGDGDPVDPVLVVEPLDEGHHDARVVAQCRDPGLPRPRRAPQPGDVLALGDEGRWLAVGDHPADERVSRPDLQRPRLERRRCPPPCAAAAVIGVGAPVSGSLPAAGLRERDDVADRRRAGQQHADAVPAERDAAVRRRAVLEARRAGSRTSPAAPPPTGRASRRPAAARRRGGYGSTRRRSRCRCRRGRRPRPAPRRATPRTGRSTRVRRGERDGAPRSSRAAPSSSAPRTSARRRSRGTTRPRSSIRPSRRPISSRAAPRSARASDVRPAAKKTQSPGSAPTAAASPARSSSLRFLATGPPSVPSSSTVT